jgi:hypothetical protein
MSAIRLELQPHQRLTRTVGDNTAIGRDVRSDGFGASGQLSGDADDIGHVRG